MQQIIKENTKSRNKKVLKSLLWILLLALTGFVIMLWISPESRALPVFLIGFFVVMVVIVLIALYINYAVSIYKQIKEDCGLVAGCELQVANCVHRKSLNHQSNNRQ